MKKVLAGVVAAAAALALTAGTGDAAVPKCGGQNAWRATPTTCYNEKVVSNGTGSVLVRTDIHFNADGTGSVTFSLPNGPVAFPIGLEVNAHTGISSSEGPVNAYFRVLPPGGDSFPIGVTLPLGRCGGQVDVKAIPGATTDRGHFPAKYRVSGATFLVSACAVSPTTTTVAPTTVPGQPTTTVAGTTVPGQPTTTSPHGLPPTGANGFVVVGIASLILAIGAALMILRRRPETP